MTRRKASPPVGDPAGIPLPCVLARHHEGDHDEDLIRAAREPIRCGVTVRYVPREEPEPEGSPESYRQREEDETQERAGRDDGGLPSSQPLPPVAGSPAESVGYPLASLAIPAILRRSIGGLSLPGILREFPGAASDAIQKSVDRALDAGSISFYMSDDEPPVRVYVDAPTMREPAEPVATAAAGEPEPPSTVDLIAAYCSECADHADALDTVANVRAALGSAELTADAAALAVGRAADRLARSLKPGGLVGISGEIFRAVAPRKPRGKAVDPAAPWTLEKVEVAK